MRRQALLCSLIVSSLSMTAQQKLSSLTVEKIMRDPKWIGTSPSSPYWSYDSKELFFSWNPEQALADSLYHISLSNKSPKKVTATERKNSLPASDISYNILHTAYVYSKDGDIFCTEIKSGKTLRVTKTVDIESDPQFSFNESSVVYTKQENLYSWDIATGETTQLTNIEEKSDAKKPAKDSTSQEKWLANDRQLYFDVLRLRKLKSDKAEAFRKSLPKAETLKSISLDGKSLFNLSISPDGQYIAYNLQKDAQNVHRTIVPNYVTQSGFTEDIPGRSKVGAPQGLSEFYIYDRTSDTVLLIKTDSLPGIHELPDYVKDYPQHFAEQIKNPPVRTVNVQGVYWSPKATNCVLDIFSDDNKDRWLMLVNPSTGKLKLLDRQHDNAWIGGPGIGWGSGGTNKGWITENDFWFQSEVTGYSHLYSINVQTTERKTITTGKYEVQQSQLSADKKYFYIITNEVNPGEQQFYRLTIANGKKERITTMTGGNQVTISPDEKNIAILYSYSNKPWELYLQENKPGGKLEQITDKAQTEEFKSYPWRDPEIITFTARDGAQVYGRLYKPATPHPSKPAVIFVHGAGYLQNAHKWWSYYYHEYMFHNLLADNGYYVIDIDYRASAGYGRDWRTGIYRHMGGKDLDDNTDAANYLVKTFGVDPKRIGVYGGSYGGFISLMALFTEPNVYAAGAALRPVTNWANYNHGYTSNILNEPFNDSLSYRKSSPLYFAEGLKGHLLICHGMVDVNVHFQDAVELTQRLIELGKDNWEIAPYPMEDHGFVEPSSWTDEYKRIYKLFETVLKAPNP
ncbi:MAG: prolyl oligopeptidase family serine peptidase [Chitinophagaceae bacterium]